MNVGWALPLLIALQTRSAPVSPRPVAWAAQSPRPAACLGEPGLWALSRQARLPRRCRELSRAQALLVRAPDQALARSAALLEEAPEFVEARVVHARASLRVGDSATAHRELSALLATDALTVADPAVVLDAGRAALAQKDLPAAARFYRVLGGGAALLQDRRQQIVAYIEIAGALLAEGSAPVDDVLAYLREARRRAPGSGFTGLCAALTAAAWSSSGHQAEAQAALAELADVPSLQHLHVQLDVWLADGMLDLLIGLALERTDPDAAKRHYQAVAGSVLAQRPLGKLALRLGTPPVRGKAQKRAP